MNDCGCLLLDPNDQSSSSTQSTNIPISMSSNSSIGKFTKESIVLALKHKKNEYTINNSTITSGTQNCYNLHGFLLLCFLHL